MASVEEIREEATEKNAPHAASSRIEPSSETKTHFIVGSRKSKLAMVQTE
jgi:hypothetical protein